MQSSLLRDNEAGHVAITSLCCGMRVVKDVRAERIARVRRVTCKGENDRNYGTIVNEPIS